MSTGTNGDEMTEDEMNNHEVNDHKANDETGKDGRERKIGSKNTVARKTSQGAHAE